MCPCGTCIKSIVISLKREGNPNKGVKYIRSMLWYMYGFYFVLNTIKKENMIWCKLTRSYHGLILWTKLKTPNLNNVPPKDSSPHIIKLYNTIMCRIVLSLVCLCCLMLNFESFLKSFIYRGPIFIKTQ
jgi:hypothetical protein